VLPEIWASGLRNPWRYTFDEVTGDLWLPDVGQADLEEVNVWPAGDNSGPNFGWRCYEGTAPYNGNGCGPASDYVFPIQTHDHGTEMWCAIIEVAFITADFTSDWSAASSTRIIAQWSSSR
jgi:glucose/arabinose dehydrogenase